MDDIKHPNLKDVTLEQIFKALSDPIRLAAIQELIEADAKGEEKACGSFNYSVTKATFSHHLQILREAGLTLTRVEGTKKLVTLRREEFDKHFPGLLKLILKSK